jgi:hypothetical protein
MMWYGLDISGSNGDHDQQIFCELSYALAQSRNFQKYRVRQKNLTIFKLK